jgi:hypothetical protein
MISAEAEGITPAAFREHNIRDARAPALIPRERVILAGAKAAVLVVAKLFERFNSGEIRLIRRNNASDATRLSANFHISSALNVSTLRK